MTIHLDRRGDLNRRLDRYEPALRGEGWNTFACDGHDAADVARALSAAQTCDKPVLIAARTTIGFGAPTRVGASKAHGEALGAAEIAGAREKLGWPYPPFVIPDDILSDWRAIGARGKAAREAWIGAQAN